MDLSHAVFFVFMGIKPKDPDHRSDRDQFNLKSSRNQGRSIGNN